MTNSFEDYPYIRMLWPDHLGLARGKYVPGRLASKGSGFCVTIFAMPTDRDLVPAPGAYLLEGLKDIHGTPEPSTLRQSWEDERIGVVVADVALGHQEYQVSSRTALAQALAAWRELGYSVKVGIELEGYLLQPDGENGWQRFSNPRSMVYGTGVLGDSSSFTQDVLWASEKSGFKIESLNIEFDESQFELTLEYDDAMAAADDAFLFRVMARELAVARGLDFTFLGKPFPDVSGSGLHVNFSLIAEDGQPALLDADRPHNITPLAEMCLAGLVNHHRALTAVCAPTVNAYRRLQPGSLAGCWGNWGVDHRNVTNRIPETSDQSMRIESRLGDGSMNIHLGIAAVLQAARLGVENNLPPLAPYEGDGFEEGGTDIRSATSLEQALDDLEADSSFVEALGSELVDNFVFNKRHEAQRFADAGEPLDSPELTAYERLHYLPFY